MTETSNKSVAYMVGHQHVEPFDVVRGGSYAYKIRTYNGESWNVAYCSEEDKGFVMLEERNFSHGIKAESLALD